jgi:transposase
MSPTDPDARITRMQDGRTHLAHKAERAVDMETGAVVAVTLQAADQGDTMTMKETIAEAGETIAQLLEREAEQAADQKPRVNVNGIEEVVADKGYHSGAAVVALRQAQARTYITEPKRPRRKWAGKADEQSAVYANRRRVTGNYGKKLLRKRGELLERSFAHCYETGGMRRVHLRGRENALKRQLIHVGAFNLSLILRTILRAGTPRELRNRQSTLLFAFIRAFAELLWLQTHLTRLRLTITARRLANVPNSPNMLAAENAGVAPRAARRSGMIVPGLSSSAASGPARDRRFGSYKAASRGRQKCRNHLSHQVLGM